MIVSDTAIRNRTTVGVLTFIIVLFGSWSYITLPRESSPDIQIPLIVVTTTYEGVSPEDVESSVTTKIEKELSGVKGVDEIRSVSDEGVSVITVKFDTDTVIDDAMQYVRDKVDLAKAELPEEADDPILTEINFSEFPILVVNLSGEISPVRLKAIADDLEDDIESIQGVLNCDVVGALEREIRLEIDQDKVAAYGLTIPEIINLVPSENINVSAGGMETPGTKFNVRVPAEFVDPGVVELWPLTVRDDKTIFLGDVADIRDTFKDRTSFSRLDGGNTITLSIQKRTGAGIIEIVDSVKYLLQQAEKQLPATVKLDITMDMSKEIRMMVADLENNLLSGMILVVGVLLLFMGWRTSVVVGIAIPLSMLLSFTVLSLLGYTLNMVVLFSLIMALGMLVDNAIVIVENIYRHYQNTGNRVKAAMEGTSEVAWPVVTSTATTLAAFSPMIFWPGIMGGFMKWLPITLIITLSCSLFVALVVSPVISSMFVKGQVLDADREGWFVAGYRRLLDIALHNPVTAIALSILLLVAVGLTYHKFGHGSEFFPEIDPKQGAIDIRFAQGTNINKTNELALEIEDRIRPILDEHRIEHVITSVGSAASNPMEGGGSVGEHLANLTLVFHDYEVRDYESRKVIDEIREELSDLRGVEITVDEFEEGPPTGDAISVELIGKDFKILEKLSEDVKNLIAGVDGVVNLRSNYEAARPELSFQVDRERAVRLGVNTAVIGNFLKTAVFGEKVGTYRQFNDEYDITVRLPEWQRSNLDELFRLRVPNEDGKPVPLSSLGSFEYAGGYGTIRRVDQKRVINLTAGVVGRPSKEALEEVQDKLAEFKLPGGYRFNYTGETEEEEKAVDFLSKAFVIALFLIVLIIVMQFNTLVVPFLIMTTVILSLIGVLVGLLVCNMPFGIIMTGVGVISLAGVVVNNAIVLLDYTRLLQRRGMDLVAAAIQAGTTRLRPVLLTAVTTILGLIPMAIGVSIDFRAMFSGESASQWVSTRSQSAQWWESMAIAIIFGLAFATLLTLVMLPAMYVLLMRIARALGGGDQSEVGV